MEKHCLKMVNRMTLIIFMFALIGARQEAFADNLADKLTSFQIMPIRYIAVKGDAAKFRALNWMNDGATGGIKEMGFDGDIGNGDHLLFQGHAIPGDNDLGASIEFTKDKGGYLKMDYGNFRRYYNVYGGFYSNFTGSASINKLAADPKMDVGHFFLEVGNGTENDSGLSFSYERFTKEGIKNMLDWGTVTQSAVSRKIIPSWEEVSQATDTLALKAKTDVAGFNVNGKQQIDFFSGRNRREDDSRLASTPALASQEQEPMAKQFVSSLQANRWIVDDKTYLAFAYQYRHLRNDVLQTVANYNTSGVIQSNSRNVVTDAQASNDSHTWVEHFVTDLAPHLNFITKFKQEIISKTGTSFSEGYSGGSNYTMEAESNVMSTGQSISLRYSGVPKVSLYTDWDFQQTRNWLSKWLKTVTTTPTTSTTYYENLNSDPEAAGVIGMRYVPNSKFNMTSQFRMRSDNNTYDTFVTADPAITISRMRTNTNEWDNRVTWKPAKWFQNSFRVQLLDNIYRIQGLDLSGFTGNNDWIKSQGNSQVYTYDVIVQPCDEWMFDLGYSLNNFKISTPASQVAPSGGGIPVFLADVHTWLLTASYAPKDNFSIFTSAQYSRAKDFDSHGFGGIPFGVDNEDYNINLGMKWSPKKSVTLEPHYGYYSYRANQSVDYGNYSAHVAWLDLSFDWF